MASRIPGAAESDPGTSIAIDSTPAPGSALAVQRAPRSRNEIDRTGEYPWWYDLHKAYPALVAAAFALLFGLLELRVHGLQ